MPPPLPLLAAHRKNALCQPIFLGRAASRHVRRIVADQVVDLFLNPSGMCEFVSDRIWRKKATHADPVDLPRRKSRRYTDNDGLLSLLPQIVPDCRRLDRTRIRDRQPSIVLVNAVTESIHANLTTILPSP